MADRDTKFDAYVLRIHASLDRTDYYRLLGVERGASRAQIKKAFYSLASKFHPDRNRDAEEAVFNAMYDVFKRVNEAYHVLSDKHRRKAYNENLREGKVRLDQDSRKTGVPQAPEDTIQSRDARQFYVQAAQEFKKGNLLQADLHLKLALAREKDSKAIKDLFAQIKAAKEAKKK